MKNEKKNERENEWNQTKAFDKEYYGWKFNYRLNDQENQLKPFI